MLNIKEYFNQIDATLAVKELDNETAAAIQGGAYLTLYDGSDRKTGPLGSFNTGTPQLSAAQDNKISSIVITEGTWRFYENKNYNSGTPGALRSRVVGKGEWVFRNDGLNNKISSFKRIDILA